MKRLELFNPLPAYAEFGASVLTVLTGEEWLDLPLERSANGRLSTACKAQLIDRLEPFFKRSPWQPKPRVICALGARGVSLRRLSLPPTTKENVPRLLGLQIESAFPLPPE